jgi:hypothetical protein
MITLDQARIVKPHLEILIPPPGLRASSGSTLLWVEKVSK